MTFFVQQSSLSNAVAQSFEEYMEGNKCFPGVNYTSALSVLLLGGWELQCSTQTGRREIQQSVQKWGTEQTDERIQCNWREITWNSWVGWQITDKRIQCNWGEITNSWVGWLVSYKPPRVILFYKEKCKPLKQTQTFVNRYRAKEPAVGLPCPVLMLDI